AGPVRGFEGRRRARRRVSESGRPRIEAVAHQERCPHARGQPMMRGSSLVELIVAMCVLGAILALGMPGYHWYGEEGRAAQCATNRHALEAAERACALKH